MECYQCEVRHGSFLQAKFTTISSSTKQHKWLGKKKHIWKKRLKATFFFKSVVVRIPIWHQNSVGSEIRLYNHQLALVQDVFPSTVCSAIILLMEEILHHLGWLKPYKWWDNHHPWWCRILSINSLTQSPPFWPHKSITLAWYAANCCVPRAAAAKAMAVYPKIRVALMIIMGPAWDRHINICREGTEG